MLDARAGVRSHAFWVRVPLVGPARRAVDHVGSSPTLTTKNKFGELK